MNVLDLVLVALAVVGAVGGYRYGLISRLAGWLGLGVGLGLSIWTVPTALDLIPGGSASLRFVLGVLVLSLTIALASALFQRLGFGLRTVVHRTPLRIVDKLAGLVGGIVVIAVLLWILLPAAAFVPGQLAAQVRGSTVVAAVERHAPAPPDAVAALAQVVDLQRFPEVFDDLRPAPDTGPPPSEIPVDQDVVATVTDATVRIDAEGCRRGYVGSGWVVGDELVVTNAHVIAGADAVRVRHPRGERFDAEVVRFDERRDLAVLRVPGLDRPALSLGEPQRDAEGVVIGYPGGQSQPRVAPITVREERRTAGRDIYREGRAERQVVFLAASLRQGDSGAPVVDQDGQVVGVVFAISPDRATTAYALAPSEVRAVLDAQETASTGRCL